ncbi:MAG TPA: FkbM family methyltransferase [Brevundimonas sp.]|jgi:FkbM family methyltransferase|uniref:FkbM family methyltransferase n=1 Tax=Brevundimonas sp. TaxID=1871086 RepID=UPI002DEF1609|nr:FkbM family methyltransferase [Brevundimonas sp.]
MKTLWAKTQTDTVSRFVNLKMADRVTRRSDRLLALRKNRQMAVFANSYIGVLVNQFGYFEHEDLETLFDWLSPLHTTFRQGVALDIGANIGNHAMWFSDHFSHVHAFEPNPRTYGLLAFNAAPLPGVTTHQMGLGDQKGELTLSADVLHPEVSSLRLGTPGLADQIMVRVETLDDLTLERKEDVCFIKIDVEGFEEQVLRGGRATIASTQPLIVMEQHGSEFSDGASPSTRLLEEMGYKFAWEHRKPLSSNWLGRRLAEIQEMVAGRRCAYVTSARIPAVNYTMLVAVPPRFQELLGI